MALPTVADFKLYIKREDTAEDALLTQLLARAVAMAEQYLGMPITAASVAKIDRAEHLHGTPAPRALVYPGRPIGTVAIVDGDGDTVDPTTYTVDAEAGMIFGNTGIRFSNGPYTITATWGLSLFARYAAQIEPAISAVILDIAADLWSRRTPGASSETGAGTTVSWEVSAACGARCLAIIRSLRLPVVA